MPKAWRIRYGRNITFLSASIALPVGIEQVDAKVHAVDTGEEVELSRDVIIQRLSDLETAILQNLNQIATALPPIPSGSVGP